MIVMNFSVLPPEVNSGLMFAGAGPGPMPMAALGWDGLADDLGSAATSISSVTSELVGGPLAVRPKYRKSKPRRR
ncbi:PPE domain-containing protein [Mycobacterium decipiens]|uniref:PPE domain-containing protein n=1 Tax=Mycobacterium decipiens TaxID=1430326 RepID=UPI003BFA2C4A